MPNAFTLFGELKVDSKGFENSLRDAEVRLNQTERAIQDTEQKARDLGQTNAKTGRTFEKLTDTVGQNRDRMRQAVDAYEKGQISVGKLSSVLRQTDSRVSGLNSRLKDMQARMVDTARSTSRFGTITKQVLSATLLAGGIEGMSRAIVGFGVDSVKAFGSLDKLVRFTATLDKNFQSPDNLRKFRQDIQNLSVEIPQSAENIAKASFTLKSAFQGLTETQLIDYLREFGNAATASNTDIASHAQNLAALAKQYNITGTDLRKFSSLIASSFGQALASDTKVAEGFNKILNSAKSTKQPLEDMVAAMSTLQSASSDAEMNTTLLLNVYAKLTDPKYLEGLKSIGVSAFDAAGNFRPLNQIINDLAKELQGLSDQDVNTKLEWAKDLQAREGIKTLVRLVGDYNRQLADGSDQEAFKRKNELMLDSAEAKWDKFFNKISRGKVELGAAIIDFATIDWSKELKQPQAEVQAKSVGGAIGMAIAVGARGGVMAGLAQLGSELQSIVKSEALEAVPGAKGAGLTLGQNISLGIANGIRSQSALQSISGAITGVINWAFSSGQKAEEAKSPSRRAARELGVPFVQGIALGITSQESHLGVAVEKTITKAMFGPGVKKAIAIQIKEFQKSFKEASTDNAATVQGYGQSIDVRKNLFGAEQVKQQLEELIGLRLELGVNLNQPLVTGPNVEREITTLTAMKEGIANMVESVKELLESDDKLGDVLALFANPTAAVELKKQADALGLTVEHMKFLAKMGAADENLFKSLSAIGQSAPGFGEPPSNLFVGTGSSSFQGGDPEKELFADLAPPPVNHWDTFWGRIKAGFLDMQGVAASWKDNFNASLGGALQGIGGILADSVQNWDGTLGGFFKSVGMGFVDMAQQIISQLIQIAVYKTVLSFLGGIGGSSGMAAPGANPSGISGFGIGGFASGGFPPVGQMSIVGERGPELFIPNTAGRIYSNSDSKKMLDGNSGRPITVINNFKSEKDGSFSKQSAEQAARAFTGSLGRFAVKGNG